MSKYEGTKTEKILWKHFQANHRHVINIHIMRLPQKKAGYEQISNIFLETANQEKRTRKNVVQRISRNWRCGCESGRCSCR